MAPPTLWASSVRFYDKAVTVRVIWQKDESMM